MPVYWLDVILDKPDLISGKRCFCLELLWDIINPSDRAPPRLKRLYVASYMFWDIVLTAICETLSFPRASCHPQPTLDHAKPHSAVGAELDSNGFLTFPTTVLEQA